MESSFETNECPIEIFTPETNQMILRGGKKFQEPQLAASKRKGKKKKMIFLKRRRIEEEIELNSKS